MAKRLVSVSGRGLDAYCLAKRLAFINLLPTERTPQVEGAKKPKGHKLCGCGKMIALGSTMCLDCNGERHAEWKELQENNERARTARCCRWGHPWTID